MQDHAHDAAAGTTVAITHPERVMYPADGITKGQVADYYRRVARWLLPGLVRRPLSLLRCPQGIGGECFFQKHHAGSLGPGVHAIALAQKTGLAEDLYVDGLQGVLSLVQMNTLEFHPWGATIDDTEHPDRLVFDLDPAPEVPWDAVKAAAREIRATLARDGLASWVRTTGGKGLHVVVPVDRSAGWDRAQAFCAGLATALAERRPERYVANMRKQARQGRIFIDWLRNGRGNTSVCNWSLRARAPASVAMPLRWEELGGVASPGQFTLAVALRRAARLRSDPWAGIEAVRQRLPG